MNETKNFNLKKPSPEDFYDVKDFNDNFDIIDTEIKSAQEKADEAFQQASNVPADAKFTDTVTSINGKTGIITKADITSLGIPAQDTVYTHPATHPPTILSNGTLPLGVVAATGTDYTTSRLRNTKFGTTEPTSLANGEVYFMYE